MLLTESIAIGLVLGFFCYEWIGLSAGGFVVPGYIALYWDRPLMVAATLCLAFIVHLGVEGISRIAIVYGRRRFMLALLTGEPAYHGGGDEAGIRRPCEIHGRHGFREGPDRRSHLQEVCG